MPHVVERLQALVSEFCHLNFNSSTGQRNASDYASERSSPVESICRECKMKSFHCVACNNISSPHLHCTGCMDRQVCDNIKANEIECPFKGCESQPFNDGQLCHVTESNTFCLHIATKNQKQELIDELKACHKKSMHRVPVYARIHDP
jgi:hypothetical protein